MFKGSVVLIVLAVFMVITFQACNRKKAKSNTDTFMTGKTYFLVDESLAPIIDEEAYVFKALYPEAQPRLVYKPESELLKLLLKDSITFAIMARDLTAQEKRVMAEHTLPADVNRFAIDAVTLIVNEASNDTTITLSAIKNMLNGKIKTDRNIVFDNPNSSLARYLEDLSGNKQLTGKNIFALKTNKEVINYVSQHPQAIGITGFGWLNDADSDYKAAVKKVKIVAIKDDLHKNDNGFTKPSQGTLALKQYPLSRSIYIINCTGRQGLGAGFAAFMLSDRGQRIVLKSGLLPDSLPGREININKKLKL